MGSSEFAVNFFTFPPSLVLAEKLKSHSSWHVWVDFQNGPAHLPHPHHVTFLNLTSWIPFSCLFMIFTAGLCIFTQVFVICLNAGAQRGAECPSQQLIPGQKIASHFFETLIISPETFNSRISLTLYRDHALHLDSLFFFHYDCGQKFVYMTFGVFINYLNVICEDVIQFC